jgi:hypothetical protein
MHRSVLLLGLLALLGLGPSAVAARVPETKKVLIEVVISDRSLLLIPYQNVGSCVGCSSGSFQWEPLPGPIPRGSYITLAILNRSRKVQAFRIFGRETPPVKPGSNATLSEPAVKPGKFAYGSSVEKSAAFRGFVRVG